jgi:hypothetical protein
MGAGRNAARQINDYLSNGEWWDPDAPPPPPDEKKEETAA